MFKPESTLLVIDVQKGFFENKPSVYDSEKILEKMVAVYTYARIKGRGCFIALG